MPTAAPIERENWTEAAAVPSMLGPAALCTVTCTTPITVPMNSPTSPSIAESCEPVRSGSRKPIAVSSEAATINPTEGKIAVYPVRLTARPVRIDPNGTLAVTGSNDRPIVPASQPSPTRR